MILPKYRVFVSISRVCSRVRLRACSRACPFMRAMCIFPQVLKLSMQNLPLQSTRESPRAHIVYSALDHAQYQQIRFGLHRSGKALAATRSRVTRTHLVSHFLRHCTLVHGILRSLPQVPSSRTRAVPRIQIFSIRKTFIALLPADSLPLQLRIPIVLCLPCRRAYIL